MVSLLFPGGVCSAHAEGRPKFRDLEDGEKLNENLVKKHFVLTDQW